MLVRLTYLLVILIWSTTPLAIKMGGSSLAPMASLSLRIMIAFLVGSALCVVFGVKGLNIRKNGFLYLAASISLFPNMALVYFATEYVSSGLISLLFGLSPFTMALLAKPILGDGVLNRRQFLAICVAVAGLLMIFFDPTAMAGDAYIGILLMLLSNIVFAVSALFVKKLNRQHSIDPVEQTLGAMAFALPGLLITWLLIVGYEPIVFDTQSLVSLLYLSLLGSLVGFVAYYFILKQLDMSVVALIPLITPVLAIILGAILADETISLGILAGAACILCGLLIHQGLPSFIKQKV